MNNHDSSVLLYDQLLKFHIFEMFQMCLIVTNLEVRYRLLFFYGDVTPCECMINRNESIVCMTLLAKMPQVTATSYNAIHQMLPHETDET